MQDPGDGRLSTRALAAWAAGVRLGPHAVTLLARTYAHTGDDAVGEAVGLLVAQTLREAAEPHTWRPVPTEGRVDWASERSAWLTLLVDVASLSEDPRLRTTITGLAHALVAEWPGRTAPAIGMRGVDACLRAAVVVDPAMAAPAVDELERVIASAYRPGSGLLIQGRDTGTVDDHTQSAAALLTAYSVSQRLPYAMLADDLMQFARRTWWTDAVPQPDGPAQVGAYCDAARVLGRLTAVHADPAYQKAAVVTPGYRHLDDAQRLLEAARAAAEALGVDGCIHALAEEEIRRIED